MSNKFCQLVTRDVYNDVPNYYFKSVKLPDTGTFYSGNALFSDTKSTTDYEGALWTGGLVADITAEIVDIIVNQGVYTTSTGQRPAGNPNPTLISYTADTFGAMTLVQPHVGLEFHFTDDVVETSITPAVGKYLIAVNGTAELIIANAYTTELVVLEVVEVKDLKVGNTWYDGFVARVVVGL